MIFQLFNKRYSCMIEWTHPEDGRIFSKQFFPSNESCGWTLILYLYFFDFHISRRQRSEK
jgi:EAL domain-containing protein (putative c-di-GMP-specific phosphodiesterase class I)